MGRNVPDIVVLDLVMAGLNGPDTLKEIRKKWGLIPVILHTGYPDSDLLGQAMESSPFTVLVKPCPLKLFVATVRRLCLTDDTEFLKKNRRPANRLSRSAAGTFSHSEGMARNLDSNQIMKKILIAEDDKKIGAALEIRLKAAGYEVQVVTDGFRGYIRALTDPRTCFSWTSLCPWERFGCGPGIEERRPGRHSDHLHDRPQGREPKRNSRKCRARPHSWKSRSIRKRFWRQSTRHWVEESKRILIAEDDRKIGAALEIRLKAAGYEVQVVPDGFRSYFRSVGHPPDLLLMDIFMPFGNGLEVAQELKSAGLADIPIIFMTASKEPFLREEPKHSARSASSKSRSIRIASWRQSLVPLIESRNYSPWSEFRRA